MPEETVSFLEMRSPSELVPGRPAPTQLDLEEVRPGGAGLLRETNVRVGRPHRWRGRTAWSDEQWEEELARTGVRAWIARVDGDAAGFVELEAEQGGDVKIVVFGLVPEFVGRGFGGTLLTLATRLAWEVTGRDDTPTRRVWLQTSTRDHPNALPNYERRGFRIFRTERRTWEETTGASEPAGAGPG